MLENNNNDESITNISIGRTGQWAGLRMRATTSECGDRLRGGTLISGRRLLK